MSNQLKILNLIKQFFLQNKYLCLITFYLFSQTTIIKLIIISPVIFLTTPVCLSEYKILHSLYCLQYSYPWPHKLENI